MNPLSSRTPWVVLGWLAGALVICLGSLPVGDVLSPPKPISSKRISGKNGFLLKGGLVALTDPVQIAEQPLNLIFPEEEALPVSNWRPSPYPVPLSVRYEDHFYLIRPIPSGSVNWALPTYRYGSTFYGQMSIHTGVDLGAELGTEVIAAGPGEVIWAGYGAYVGRNDPDDPYGRAVVIEHSFGYQGRTVFTVYAHMDEILVETGQRVSTRDVLGTVGMTGKTTGPHLHFEVRLGSNSYYETRNPELWMTMPQGWGVLAGRVSDSYGRPLEEHPVSVYSKDDGRHYPLKTYAALTVNPDSAYRESFAISDLPAGEYELRIEFNGRAYRTTIFVHPGQTNFFEFRGRSGFRLEERESPPDLTQPPYS